MKTLQRGSRGVRDPSITPILYLEHLVKILLSDPIGFAYSQTADLLRLFEGGLVMPAGHLNHVSDGKHGDSLSGLGYYGNTFRGYFGEYFALF
jgi:hypothetical protein